MNDSGLHKIIREVLDAKTKKAALEYIGKDVGDDYVKIANELADRVNFHRTTNQNAQLHTWYGKIAKFQGDTAADVRGECHHKWALAIRLRNEQFAWLWSQTGAKRTYEQQCKILASSHFAISSAMTTKELAEYMDAIERHYAAQGLVLQRGKDEE